MENVKCCGCGARCQDSEVISVEYLLPLNDSFRTVFPWIYVVTVYLCPFCSLDPDDSIPYVITPKGQIEANKRGRGTDHAS